MDVERKYEKLLSNYEEHSKRILKATTVDIFETVEQKAARIKILSADYARWFEYYFPHYAKAKCAWFHTRFANDVVNANEVYELFEAYRSSAKSVHANMGVPLYLYVLKKLGYMLLVGETEPKAKTLLSSIQAQLRYNQRFINDYGEKFKHGDWSEGNFVTTDGVRFRAMGWGQNPRGLREEAARPDYIVVDDVDNKKHVNSDRLMADGVEYITEEIWGCFDEADGAIKRFVYCNNNFHKNSITNRLKTVFNTLIQRAKQSGEKPAHKVLTVRAVKDLQTFTPEWPEKTSAAYWKRKFDKTPYRSFMREYMHVHIQDGRVFRYDDMQWKKVLPLREYDALELYGDMSYKTTACFKGLVLVGKKGREYHIITVFLRQATRTAAAKWLYDTYERMGLENHKRIRYRIEGLFAMDEFVNDFDTEGDVRGYHVPVTADKRPKNDKYDRIEATQSFFERRNVWFNADEKDNADQIELIEQYLAFEKGGDYPVDGIDAVEGALSKLNRATKQAKGKYVFAKKINRKF
jgi:hypothetical protein